MGKMNKDEVVCILEEIAQLLELKGENPFKVRAYRRRAKYETPIAHFYDSSGFSVDQLCITGGNPAV